MASTYRCPEHGILVRMHMPVMEVICSCGRRALRRGEKEPRVVVAESPDYPKTEKLRFWRRHVELYGTEQVLETAVELASTGVIGTGLLEDIRQTVKEARKRA